VYPPETKPEARTHVTESEDSPGLSQTNARAVKSGLPTLQRNTLPPSSASKTNQVINQQQAYGACLDYCLTLKMESVVFPKQ
jgi:hypothetical protein